jgi:hypothetical protein
MKYDYKNDRPKIGIGVYVLNGKNEINMQFDTRHIKKYMREKVLTGRLL